jgi:hypothetical protein
MRFLSLNRPPRERLTRRELLPHEMEWWRYWRRIRNQRRFAHAYPDFWEPRRFFTFISTVVFLTLLLLLFSR